MRSLEIVFKGRTSIKVYGENPFMILLFYWHHQFLKAIHELTRYLYELLAKTCNFAVYFPTLKCQGRGDFLFSLF